MARPKLQNYQRTNVNLPNRQIEWLDKYMVEHEFADRNALIKYAIDAFINQNSEKKDQA